MVDVQSERESGRELRREAMRIQCKTGRSEREVVCLWRNVTVFFCMGEGTSDCITSSAEEV